MKSISLFAIIVCLMLMSCNKSSLKTESWGKDVQLYTMTNKKGMQVKITNYGGIIVSIMVPDKRGKIEDVALGYDSLQLYVSMNPYFGALIGRYGNRIAKGKFSLNGKEYTLATNNGPNHLHGGRKGFDKQVWTVDGTYTTSDSSGIILSYFSKDGEEGYPGNLKVKVTYTLTNDNEIKINYEGETDSTTIFNPTNHCYFNLTGCKESILNHELVFNADSITPTDSTLIPTGKIQAVNGTDFDFTKTHKIGERIQNVPGGYDINYKLNKKSNELSLAAEVYEPKFGRVLQVYTTEPGIQFYSGNFLDGSIVGHKGTKYEKYYGFCLEGQHFPDSPNKPNFPDVILNPGEKYAQHTIYKFSTK